MSLKITKNKNEILSFLYKIKINSFDVIIKSFSIKTKTKKGGGSKNI
jgi:hypothetical protein